MRSKYKYPFAILILLFIATLAWPARAPAETINVVTTTTDLASLATTIGADKVEVQALVPNGFNPDLYSPRPSDLFKIHRAGLFIQVGLGLEDWARDLVNEANNANLVKAQVSSGIALLDVPQGRVDYSFGDIHPFGNPHYQLDPEAGRRMAKNIFNALVYVDSADRDYFSQNLAAFEVRLTEAEKKWTAEMAPFAGSKFVPYHESWDYFARAYKLQIPEPIESKPGFPPSPARVQEVIRSCRSDGVKLIVAEPYYDVSIAQLISQQAGIPYLNLYIDVGGTAEQKDYISTIDYIVTQFAKALSNHGK